MPCHRLIPALAAALLLAACATEEYRRAEAECTQQALAAHPVVLEDQMAQRSRRAWVPDGSTVCESTSTSISSDSHRRTIRSGDARDDRDGRDTRDSQESKKPKNFRHPPGTGHAGKAENAGSADGAPAQKSTPARTVSTERGSAMAMETTQTVQVCRPGMREVTEYYLEPVRIDINAEPRGQFIASCSAALCMQRMGNARCRH